MLILHARAKWGIKPAGESSVSTLAIHPKEAFRRIVLCIYTYISVYIYVYVYVFSETSLNTTIIQGGAQHVQHIPLFVLRSLYAMHFAA